MLTIASSEVCPLSSKPPSERESAAVRPSVLPSVRACATRASDSLGLFGLSPFDGRAGGKEGKGRGPLQQTGGGRGGRPATKEEAGRGRAEGGGLD